MIDQLEEKPVRASGQTGAIYDRAVVVWRATTAGLWAAMVGHLPCLPSAREEGFRNGRILRTALANNRLAPARHGPMGGYFWTAINGRKWQIRSVMVPDVAALLLILQPDPAARTRGRFPTPPRGAAAGDSQLPTLRQ